MKDQRKDFFTTSELASLLGISRIAVFNKIKSGLIKAQKQGRNFIILRENIDIELLSSNLFAQAKKWMISGQDIKQGYYCQNSGIFQARLTQMESLMAKYLSTKNLSPLLTSISGEIGNNSFDHNIGQWPDMPGIFFGFDLIKKQIVLADCGLGVLKTLQRVRPELKSHGSALKVAFSEVISSRRPEPRGNGLKYVRHIITKYPINLFFQTGNAKLFLKHGSEEVGLLIEEIQKDLPGCLALITY